MDSRPGTQQDATDYLEVNKAFWNDRAAAHAKSATYNRPGFLNSPTYLSEVVTYDLPRLPSLKDLRVVHLQCHIGTDSLSLARLGAASVTGLDFSADSLKEARSLAAATRGSGGEKMHFVEGDVYDAAKRLGLLEGSNEFDVVFTGIGVLCWLPRVKEWARVVSSLLKPGGRFHMREGHPILWSIDDAVSAENPLEKLSIKYPYFERDLPTVFDDAGTYAEAEPLTDGDATGMPNPGRSGSQPEKKKLTFETTITKEFNHSIGEIVQALIDAGLRITLLQEHDSVPWDALPGRMDRIEVVKGVTEWRLHDRTWRLPHSYTIQAIKL